MEDRMKTDVARGARLLDQKRPDWYRDINIDTLDMGVCYDCILGQLYRDYGNGVHAVLAITDEPANYGFSIHREYGEPPASEKEWKLLADVWIKEIQNRIF
jgi:hypothetical protein